MSYRLESPTQRRSGGGRCLLTGLVVLVFIVLGALLVLRYVVRPIVTNAIQERIAQQLPQLPNVAELPLPEIAPGDVPPGSFSIGEADANAWLQEHRSEFGSIDDLRMRFTPEGVAADLTVGGFTSTATASLVVQDGKIVAVNPRLGQPLSQVVDITPFVTLLQDRFNADLATLGRRVTGISTEGGSLTITLE